MESSIEDAYKLLRNDTRVPRKEDLPELEGYLQIRTTIYPVFIGGSEIDFRFDPPQHTFVIHQIADDPRQIGKKLIYSMMKAKTYFAFVVGAEVPFAFIIKSKRNYIESHVSGGDLSFFFAGGLKFLEQIREPEKHISEWESRTLSCFSFLENMFKFINDGSLIDEAITKMGRAVEVNDFELSFVLRWQALELVAKDFSRKGFERYNQSKSESLTAFLNLLLNTLSKKKRMTLSEGDIIGILLESLQLKVESEQMRQFAKLRNDIIHSNKDYADIMKDTELFEQFSSISRNAMFKVLDQKNVIADPVLR